VPDDQAPCRSDIGPQRRRTPPSRSHRRPGSGHRGGPLRRLRQARAPPEPSAGCPRSVRGCSIQDVTGRAANVRWLAQQQGARPGTRRANVRTPRDAADADILQNAPEREHPFPLPVAGDEADRAMQATSPDAPDSNSRCSMLRWPLPSRPARPTISPERSSIG
jgi:hypothetical protein